MDFHECNFAQVGFLRFEPKSLRGGVLHERLEILEGYLGGGRFGQELPPASPHRILAVGPKMTYHQVCGSIVWSNYSDLTRPISPKWWFGKNPIISGKSRLVKYYNLASIVLGLFA